MKHEDKKHFDVSKPRRKSPDPTSKPIIVGHHPMMPDPMILEEREKAPKPITVISDGDEPESLTVTNSNKKDESLEIGTEDSPVVVPADPAPEAKPEQSDEQPMPPPEVPPESAPGAIFHPPEKTDKLDAPLAEPTSEETKEEMPESLLAEPEAPVAAAGTVAVAEGIKEEPVAETPIDKLAGKEPAPPVPAEPPAGQELHIPAGTGHAQVRHKPRIWVWITIGIIILIWIYAAVDALTNTKLPLEFFENSNQTAQPVTNASVQTATPAQTTPPATSAFVLPSGWTWYENKALGFKFAHPKEWGTVTASSENYDKGSSTQFKFSKQKLALAGVVSKDIEYGADGQCYVVLGIRPVFGLNDIKKYYKSGDKSFTQPDGGSKQTIKVLKSTNNEFVYEQFEAGAAGIGSCPGVSVGGYKSFTDQSKYLGIEFFWGNGKTSNGVPVAEFDKYKADPNAFLSEKNRQDFIKAVESATSI